MEKIDLKNVLRRNFANRPNDAYTFDEVSEQFLRWRAKAYRCKRGEICVQAGTPATEFAMVASGVLHVRMRCDIGDDIIIRAVRANEYVGLTHLFSPVENTHRFDVVAAMDSEFVTFNVAEMRKWRTDPKSQPLFDYLGSLVCDVCRDAQAKAAILSGADIAERLRRYLAFRMQRSGERTIAIPGTSGDLAKYLAVNNCALSRAIGRLREEGKIEFKRNVFTVL